MGLSRYHARRGRIPDHHRVRQQCGRRAKKNNLETNFGISADGEAVFLFTPDGTILDKILVPAGRADVSYGRSGTSLLYYETPTPNAANGSGLIGYADEPVFLLAGGAFDSAQSVTIEVPEGTTVTYTTDGSVPTENSTRYSGAISISRTTPLRARAFQSGYGASDIASQTYIIYTGESTIQSHTFTLPIVSVVTDPDNMWDGETGIYVVGNDYAAVSGQNPSDLYMTAGMGNDDWNLANFNAQPISHPDPLGRNWERDVHFDYIDENGVTQYSGDGIIRVFGAYSRNKEQKGLAIIARAGYGDTLFEYPFFTNRDFTSYKSLLLRASGQDATNSRIRDNVICSLFEDADFGLSPENDIYVQAHQQVVVLINGAYWGVYDFEEKLNESFIAQHYGIVDTDSIDILMGNGNVNCVVAGNGWEDYTDMVEWAGSHDLSDPVNYEYICSLMDVENFATYCAAEIVVGNTDTGNIKYWRSTETDHKWRWLFYDFCWAMNRNDNNSDAYTSGYRRDFFTRYFDPEGHDSSKGTSTVLSRALLANSSFRALFLEKVAMMLNDAFTPEKINARVDELENNIAAEMVYDVDLWDNITYKYWQQHCDNIRDYANHYQEYCLKYVQNYFSLSDSDMISIFGRVSSLESE